MNMGPRRDVVGTCPGYPKQGMKFVSTFHHHWRWGWFPTMDKTTDASDPEYADLMGHRCLPALLSFVMILHPSLIAISVSGGSASWEVIDRDRPDLVWIDDKMQVVDEQYRKELLAYYYDRAAEWNREVSSLTSTTICRPESPCWMWSAAGSTSWWPISG